MVTNRDIANMHADIDASNGWHRDRLRTEREAASRSREIEELTLKLGEAQLSLAESANRLSESASRLSESQLSEARKQTGFSLTAVIVASVSLVLSVLSIVLR